MRAARVKMILFSLSLLLGCGKNAQQEEVPVATIKKQKFSRIVEADGYLRAVKATQVMLPAQAQGSFRIAWLAEDGSIVKKGEPLVRFDSQELKQRLADAEDDRSIALAEKGKESVLRGTDSQARSREIRASLRELKFQRTFAPKDSEIFSRDEIIEGEAKERLKESEVRIAHDSATVGQRLDRSKIGSSDVNTKKAEENIRRAKLSMQALELVALHNGVFLLDRNNKNEPIRVGDSVWRGRAVGEVSLVEEMESEIFVLEAEATGLAEGRKAEVFIEAQPDKPYAARIKRVTKVAKSNQSGSQTQYFGVTLSLDKTQPDVMKPGQRVRANLFLHEEEALVMPRPALFEQEGSSIAYRKNPSGGFSLVTVKIGQATAGLLTIEAGLREGDVVALRDPGKSADTLLSGPPKSKTGPN